MIERIVLLGASGDLVERYIAPALVSLREHQRLPEGFELVGVARDEWDTDGFRAHLASALDEHAPTADGQARDWVLEHIHYHRADATDARSIAPVLDGQRPVAAYLALPPAVFAGAFEALAEVGLPDGSRVVAEKPFGDGLESARTLNRLLHKHVGEDRIHRVDHFLGMNTVRGLVGLRFANRLLEPLWDRHHIARVDVVWDETLTLEGRARYYDDTGALQDMLQNHLLQVLALIAMDPPASMQADDLRDRKAQVLREVRRMDVAEAARRSTRARYTSGWIGGRDVPAYVDEEGVDPDNGTETFAEVTLAIDNWRWAGVPFRLRSGKALARDRREVVITFRQPAHRAFVDVDLEHNQLRIELEPERLGLRLNLIDAGEAFQVDAIELARDLPTQDLPAYGQVLLAILEGDPTLSIRGDEAEASWEIVTPVLEAWSQDGSRLREYAAGSDGP